MERIDRNNLYIQKLERARTESTFSAIVERIAKDGTITNKDIYFIYGQAKTKRRANAY